MSVAAVELAKAKLAADGASDALALSFSAGLDRLIAGETGMISEESITPLDGVVGLEELPPGGQQARDALSATVVIKLNGGLGTGMGMTRAKSLIDAHGGMSFLDVIAHQVLAVRARSGVRLPLVLMNSFATQADSLAALHAHEGIEADVPLDFLQNRVPKLRADDLSPVEWANDPELEWAPPGHGDIYAALAGSGLLAQLRGAGYRYAFISNADNLAAVIDERILGWIAREGIPFVMEAADRTEADRKGGHLAASSDGGLVLREVAQTAQADLDAFQDVDRHRLFNTNSLWIDLGALTDLITRHGGGLDLPLILNEKTVDPKDPSSTPVIQLETAMGAAVSLFEGAQALRVPRSRFSPVKSTSDLLVLRSDASCLDNDFSLGLAAQRNGIPPVIDLDTRFYRLLSDFDARFKAGPPSLIGCERLSVVGDVSFGEGVVVEGSVSLNGESGGALIPGGAHLTG